MKKNKAMRAAGGLFIATMLSTSIVSGTYAKYVTKGSAQDEARVAAFGVYVNGTGNLFDETYWDSTQTDHEHNPAGKSDGNPETNPDGAQISVKSLATYGSGNVVAPGTKNTDGITLSLTGQPEVDVAVTYDFGKIKDIFLAAPAENGKYPDLTDANATEGFGFTGEYHPLVFTLKGKVLGTNADAINAALLDTDITVTGDDENSTVTGTLADIETVFTTLNGLNGGKGIIYHAGTDFGGANSANYTLNLTWEWVFEETTTTSRIIGEGATKTVSNGEIDKMDTLLGDFAAIAFKGGAPEKGVKVSDIVATDYGFIKALKNLATDPTFTDDANINSKAANSADIFKGLFGAVTDYDNNVGAWLDANASSFHDQNVFDADSYTTASTIEVPETQYNLEVAVDFSITVTQVD